jgi:hypothetical protein
VNKNTRAVTNRFWWPTVQQDVEAYVMAYDVCQRNKGDRRIKGRYTFLNALGTVWAVKMVVLYFNLRVAAARKLMPKWLGP